MTPPTILTHTYPHFSFVYFTINQIALFSENFLIQLFSNINKNKMQPEIKMRKDSRLSKGSLINQTMGEMIAPYSDDYQS